MQALVVQADTVHAQAMHAEAVQAHPLNTRAEHTHAMQNRAMHTRTVHSWAVQWCIPILFIPTLRMQTPHGHNTHTNAMLPPCFARNRRVKKNQTDEV